MRRFSTALLAALCFFAYSSAAQDYETDTVESDVTEVTSVSESSDTAFSLITASRPVQVRKVPEQRLRELKASDDYWYANAEPEKREEPKAVSQVERRPSLIERSWFRNLLWLVILFSFLGVVGWYLASSNIRLFRQDSKKILEDDEASGIVEDIFSVNYEKEIGRAESAGDFRLAVRLWYLRTLKESANRNVIDWRPETPNGAYALHLYGSRFYTPFFRLTRNFEYVWYGGFAPSAEAYTMMKGDFQNFFNSLPA